MRRSAKLFPGVLDFADIYPEVEARENFWDIGHMKKSLGARVLERTIDSGTAPGFGTPGTEEKVETHLQNLAQNYADWIAEHPDAQRIVSVSWGFAKELPEEDVTGSAEAELLDVPASDGAPQHLKTSDTLHRQGTLPLPPLSLRAIYAVFEAEDGTRFYTRAQKRRYDDIAFQQVFHDGRSDPCTYEIDAPLAKLPPGTYRLRMLSVGKEDTSFITPVLETLNLEE